MAKELYTEQKQPDFSTMNSGEKIMWRTGLFRVPYSLSKEQAYDRLMNRIAETECHESRQVVRMPVRLILTAAAAALFLVGFWFVFNHKSMENIIAEKGHQTDCRLPDGSMVSLNADSRISYRKTSFNKKRNVKMEGEAFFSIEKGTPFTITTGLADIRILGTSFNVFAREGTFKVSCFTGQLLITSRSQSLMVSPMETASIENNKLVKYHDENITASTGWRSGEFNFENAALNLVFNEIERQYNVTFVLPKIDDKFFTGNISNKNLVDALDIVCLPMGLTYEIGSNSKIFIKYKTD
jgi:ferric-dicitrate binding protein FerR (iron transport regulator)